MQRYLGISINQAYVRLGLRLLVQGSSDKFVAEILHGLGDLVAETWVDSLAGEPDATEHAIPKGFQVAVGEDGSIEIGLSQWVHDRFEAIAENLPACPAKRRRQAISAYTRRRTY